MERGTPEPLPVRAAASAAGDVVSEEESLPPGLVLADRYRVLSRVGGGGMGIVYRARDLTLGRDIALKVMRDSDDPALRERFRREAQLASRVHHPHTVYVTDVGEMPDGRGFLAMELLHGGTLAEEFRKQSRMDPLRVCRIGTMIASGMQSVHEAGIIHRDLKPSNVFLLDKEGTRDFVKIVDFGVAKDLGHGGLPGGGGALITDSGEGAETMDSGADRSVSALTRTGAIVGTPRYMAPEQLRGELVDARADQYALGCILYEALTGSTPFAGTARQVARGHLYGEVVSPRRAEPRAQISRELEKIVLRAMSRPKEARFPEMRSLAKALQEEAERLQQKHSGPTWAGTAGHRVAIGGVVLLTLGLGSMLLIRGFAGERRAESTSPPERATAPLADMNRTRTATKGKAASSEVPVRSDVAAGPLPAPDVGTERTDAAPIKKPLLDPNWGAHGTPSQERSVSEPVSVLVARATDALRRNDALAAQRILHAVRARCGKSGSASGCAEHAAAVAVSLGRIHEAEGHWAEALSEYSRVLEGARGAGHAAAAVWREEAEAGAVRLAPRLGRVIVTRARGGRCEEVTLFLPPGEHRMEIDGQNQLITIKARETQRLGRCAAP